jgi:hypothetical protein
VSENNTKDSEMTELVGLGATAMSIGEDRGSAPAKSRSRFQSSELWAIAMVGLMFAVAIAWLVHRFG